MFDMHREAAAKRPGVLTKVGLDTFVDPRPRGLRDERGGAASRSSKKVEFEGEDWLYFPAIVPDVAIIRATTADERGNLTYEQEGAYLGAHGAGAGRAQQRRHRHCPGEARRRSTASLKPHDVRVPGILVDTSSSTRTSCRRRRRPTTRRSPARSSARCHASRARNSTSQGHRPARRAWNFADGWAVNIGFGISANVPRILLEEGQHGKVTWVIEQGAVGGVPLLDFKFGCSSNAEAFVPRRTSSSTSRPAASIARCCPSCRSTATARSMCRSSRRGRM